MQRDYRYEYMLPDKFQKEIEKMPVLFVPTGLLEWHGDHLPLGLDALKVHRICLMAAERMGGGIVLPPNYYGRPGYSSYTGTLTYSEECMDKLFSELFLQLKKIGAKVIVLLTGHYGECQMDFIKKASGNFMKAYPEISIIAQAEYEGIVIDGETPADHAGKWETSMFLHLYPEHVYMERFKMETAKKKIYLNPPNDYYKEEEQWIWSEDLNQTASVGLGKRVVDSVIEALILKIRKVL